MLTKRRILMCQHFVADNCTNASKAARDAGYNQKHSNTAACNLMQNLEVQLYIEELKVQQAAVAGITRESVIEAFGKIAFSNVQDLYDSNGGLVPIHKLDRDAAYSIEQMEVVTANDGDEVLQLNKIKVAKKLDALKELGKHFNIYEDHQASSGTMVVNFAGKFADV